MVYRIGEKLVILRKICSILVGEYSKFALKPKAPNKVVHFYSCVID